jgi:hypothetical protein
VPARPLIEVAIGTVDGANRVFRTSTMYVPGSLQVWLNGQLKRRDFQDGWTELGAGKFEMAEAPRVGDVVQAFYRPL